jgi:hypothetical protein
MGENAVTDLVDLPAPASPEGIGYEPIQPDQVTPVHSLTNERMRPTPILMIDGTPPPWAPAVVTRLNALLALPEGWDTYGGAQLDLQAAVGGLQILTAMGFVGPIPHLAPSPDGDLVMEWDVDGASLSVEVSPTGEVTVSTGADEWTSAPDGDSTLRLAFKHLAAAANLF